MRSLFYSMYINNYENNQQIIPQFSKPIYVMPFLCVSLFPKKKKKNLNNKIKWTLFISIQIEKYSYSIANIAYYDWNITLIESIINIFFLCINHYKSCQPLWKILCSKTFYFYLCPDENTKNKSTHIYHKKLFIHTLKSTILHIFPQLIQKCLFFKNVHILTH